MERHVYGVSELNGLIKAVLDSIPQLGNVCVRGEISNYKYYPSSGHHYFSLKDNEGTIRCVMFKGQARYLRFRPENGMQVLAVGRVSVFPRDGAYQLYCDALSPEGVGDLHVAFEQLKEKLWKEGLFDERHKKPLPPYPRTIALITSGVGAAVRDMIRILGRRYPLAKVKVLPIRVQGQEAPAEIVGALRYANKYRVADLIITGRGGGSIEDLWAFNDEQVARAIFASEIPVISAVGHEPDVTIADYVADLRAATPSNGAELAVPNQEEETARLNQMTDRLMRAQRRLLRLAGQELNRLQNSRVLRNAMSPVEDGKLLVDELRRRMSLALQRKANENRQRLDVKRRRMPLALKGQLSRRRGTLSRLAAGLDAMSPLKVLGRGYAIGRRDGCTVTSVEQVELGDEMEVLVSDGVLNCVINGKEERSWQ